MRKHSVVEKSHQTSLHQGGPGLGVTERRLGQSHALTFDVSPVARLREVRC